MGVPKDTPICRINLFRIYAYIPQLAIYTLYICSFWFEFAHNLKTDYKSCSK